MVSPHAPYVCGARQDVVSLWSEFNWSCTLARRLKAFKRSSDGLVQGDLCLMSSLEWCPVYYLCLSERNCVLFKLEWILYEKSMCFVQAGLRVLPTLGRRLLQALHQPVPITHQR